MLIWLPCWAVGWKVKTASKVTVAWTQLQKKWFTFTPNYSRITFIVFVISRTPNECSDFSWSWRFMWRRTRTCRCSQWSREKRKTAMGRKVRGYRSAIDCWFTSAFSRSWHCCICGFRKTIVCFKIGPYNGNTEKEMATDSSILAWKTLGTEEPGGLQSTGSWRVGHDWACTRIIVIKNKQFKNVLLVTAVLNIKLFI